MGVLSEKSKQSLGSDSKFSNEITHFCLCQLFCPGLLNFSIKGVSLGPPQARRAPATGKIYFLCLRRRRAEVPCLHQLLVKQLHFKVTSMLWWDIWGWPALAPTLFTLSKMGNHSEVVSRNSMRTALPMRTLPVRSANENRMPGKGMHACLLYSNHRGA